MGILRLLLALSVVIAHSAPVYGYRMTGGVRAVQGFYLISGFYMALILNEKYVGRGAIRAFYRNRFLRLFPGYWIILIATVLVSLASWTARGPALLLFRWRDWLPELTSTTVLLGVAANAAVFLQDVFMFLAIDPDGELRWTSRFSQEPRPAWRLLAVPQAWSLSVELWFYLVAPWMVRSLAVTISACVLSLGLRIYLHALGLYHDPWSHRFFPAELLLFGVGALGYFFYRARLKGAKTSPALLAAAAVAIVSVLFHQHIFSPSDRGAAPWIFYGLMASSIPFLFRATSESKLDAFLGQLSYPVYLSHFLVVDVLRRLPSSSKDVFALKAVLWTLIASWALHLLARPFEEMRRFRKA